MSASHRRSRRACSASIRRPTGPTRSTPAARTYPETNCYTDIIIELLHARGDEPLAALGSLGPPRLRGRPVDVLQARPGATSSCSSASTSTRCSRTGRCRSRSRSSSRGPDADRRARRLVPARHRGHQLSPRTRQDVGRDPEAIDLDDERLRYFHNASLYELEGEDFRGVFRSRARCSGRCAAAVHGAGPLRRRAPAGRRRPRGCVAREPLRYHLDAGPAERTRSGASASGSSTDLPVLLDGDEADLPRVRLRDGPDGRRRVRAAAPSHVDWLLGRAGAPASGGDGRDRRRLPRSSASSWPGGGRSTRAEALGGLMSDAGPGDERAATRSSLTPCAVQTPCRHRVARHDIRPLDHGWEVARGSPTAPTRSTWTDPGARPGHSRRRPSRRRRRDPARPRRRRRGRSGPRSRRPRPGAARMSCSVSTASPPSPRSCSTASGSSRRASRCSRPHEIEVRDRLRGTNELAIRCLAAAPRPWPSPRKPARPLAHRPRRRRQPPLVPDVAPRPRARVLAGSAGRRPVATGLARAPSRRRRRRPPRPARLDGDAGVLLVDGRMRSLDGTTPDQVPVELDGPSGHHAVALELSPADGGITVRRGRCGSRPSRAGGRTRTALPPSTRSAWSSRVRDGDDRRSMPDASDSGRSPPGPSAATTTSSATASTCTSTASACSPAVRSGHRSTSSGSPTAADDSGRPSSCAPRRA